MGIRYSLSLSFKRRQKSITPEMTKYCMATNIYEEVPSHYNKRSISLISEGLLITCSYDYLTDDWNHKSFILYAFICNYVMPMSAVIFFYSQIVKAVVSHEASLKKQAAKMNVDSLRSNVVSKANEIRRNKKSHIVIHL